MAVSNGTMPSTGVTAATALRRRIEDPQAPIVVCPGVYDGLSAQIALHTGFDAMYMTGAGSSATMLGHADLGVLSMPEMRAHAEMIANIDPSVPLIADADTGYGGPIMVARTTQAYARGGVAGLHIEDQVQTKRCGHLQGKEVVSLSVFQARIRAAVKAREQMNSDIVIIARTDALQTDGWDEAIRRLRAARDCGADVGFLEGVRSKEEAARVVKEMGGFPMLLNMVYGGATPDISAKEAAQMGYRIIIFPLTAVSVAYHAIKASMQYLKKMGEVEEDGKLPPRKIFEAVGLEKALKVDAEAGGIVHTSGL